MCGANFLSIKEADTLAILNESVDLSHGSEELLEKTRDRPHAGLLSPERANFLHPFSAMLRGNVLLIGDSGALARYVAELGCSVWVSQPKEALATLARARYRGLNVKIASTVVPGDVKFDAIIVTEPPAGFDFQPLRDALTSSGVIIVAANNRLRRATAQVSPEAVTRTTLEKDLRSAGFGHIRFCYLFPSFEKAQLIIPSDLIDGYPGIEGIIDAYAATKAFTPADEEWWRDVLGNGILRFMANSFVALASLQRVTAFGEGELLRIYSSKRRKHFARMATLEQSNGGLIFLRSPLFPNADPPAHSFFVRRSYAEPYLAGRPYSKSLEPILQTKGWTAANIAAWAKPWIDLLRPEAKEEEFRGYIGGFRRLLLLPPHYLDCIPANIMLDANGKLAPFDFEYQAVAPIPLGLVVFRGLYYALSSATAHSGSPAPRLIHLVSEVMDCCGLKTSEFDVSSFIETEAALQNDVAAASPESTEAGMRAAVLHTGALPDAWRNEFPAITAELFWKDRNSEYALERSSNAAFGGYQARQTLRFAMPPWEKAIESLRLDPCDRRGVFYLYAIRLFDGRGENIWSWDRNPDTLAVNPKDIKFEELPTGAQGVLLYSESEDPHFELAVHQDLLARLQSGGRLELEISLPDSDEYRILMRRLLDTKALREQVAVSKALNRELADQARTAEKLVELERARAQKAQAELERTLHDVRAQLQRLSADTLRAERTRDRLSVSNLELQEQLKTMQDQLKNVSNERHARAIAEMQAQIEQLSARVNYVEQLVMGLFQGRIWRTLTSLGSPVKTILRRK